MTMFGGVPQEKGVVTNGRGVQPPSNAQRYSGLNVENRPLFSRIIFTTSSIAIGLCISVGIYAAASRPSALDRIVLSSFLLVPALMFVSARSTLLLDYLLIIITVNRELRRLLDWGEGQYDVTPLVSLVPLLIAALMLGTVTKEWRQLSPAMRKGGVFLAAAMLYGLGIGLLGFRLAAIYACADYVAPLIVLYYCVSLRPSMRILYRWATVLGTLGVLTGAYGIYQWIDPPPWDATWVNWSTMWTSMGSPTPYALSICSTLESRGPAAMFFAVTTSALIVLPELRRRGGVFLAAVPATALLLTRARTGLIYLLLALLASAMFARHRGGRMKIVLTLLAVACLTVFILERQEQSNVIFDRVDTLRRMDDDESITARLGIAKGGFMSILANPLGLGFGSGGTTAFKMSASGEQQAVGDNGYLEIISILGVPGATLYAIGLGLIVRVAIQNRRFPTFAEPTTQLAFGLLSALVPALVIGNALSSVHASYVWILMSRQLNAQRDHSARQPARSL